MSTSFYIEGQNGVGVGPPGPTGPTRYRYAGFAVSNILADEVLMDHIVCSTHTLPPSFGGCQASCGTPPTEIWIANVYRTPKGQTVAAQIGTINISVLGAVSMTTTGDTSKTIAIGDVITVIAPHVVDPTIARVRFTFDAPMATP